MPGRMAMIPSRRGNPLQPRKNLYLRIVIVALLLAVAAFGAHLVLQLLVVYAVGSDGSIVARPWQLGYVNFSIWSLQAVPAAHLDAVRQSIVAFFGPFLAAIPLAALLWYVREPIPMAALIANVIILVFYAVVDLLAVLLPNVWSVEVPVLTTPEFNYGVPLAVVLVTALAVWLASNVRGQPIPE